MARRRKAPLRLRGIPLGDWHMVFAAGHDYLGDLEAYGLTTEAEIHAAAREAWRFYRATFMATWRATPERPLPWAAVNFG